MTATATASWGYSDRLTDDWQPSPSEPAPKPGCSCAICSWCRRRSVNWPADGSPIRPADPQWFLLLRLSEGVER